MSEPMKAIGTVMAVNGGALIISSLTEIELWLKVISLIAAIGYTSWRWINEFKQSKKKKK